MEWPNDGYSTQTTALGILSYLGDVDKVAKRNVSSITKWLQDMRNTDYGFASTQDTFWAMKALREVAADDRDRGIYALQFILKLTSMPQFSKTIDVGPWAEHTEEIGNVARAHMSIGRGRGTL